MSTYLLSCDCGNSVPVEIGQAGGRIECPSCGARLEVPTLRKLRHLPVAATPETQRRPPQTTRGWGARQGVIAAGLILAGLLAGVAAWNRFTEPVVPQFDPQARLHAVEHGLEDLTPERSWEMWVHVYRPLAETGFPLIEDPHKHAIEREVAGRRFFQWMMLAAAAVVVFITVMIAVALGPRSAPPRG